MKRGTFTGKTGVPNQKLGRLLPVDASEGLERVMQGGRLGRVSFLQHTDETVATMVLQGIMRQRMQQADQ